EGQFSGHSYTLERVLPGWEARTLMVDPVVGARVQAAALRAISQLHQRTSALAAVNTPLLDLWIEQPLLSLRRWNAALPRAARNDATIDTLAGELWTALAGRTLTLSWIHGDFWAGNLLMTRDGASVTG